MYENQAWNLIDPPEGMQPIERKWIYKENKRGYLHLLKARLVKKEFLTKFKELTMIRLDLKQ